MGFKTSKCQRQKNLSFWVLATLYKVTRMKSISFESPEQGPIGVRYLEKNVTELLKHFHSNQPHFSSTYFLSIAVD